MKHLCQKIFLRKNKKEKKTRIPLILSFPFVRSRLPLILSVSRTRATGAVVLGFARDESDSRPRGDPARAHGAATRGRARRPGAGGRGHARAHGTATRGRAAGTARRQVRASAGARRGRHGQARRGLAWAAGCRRRARRNRGAATWSRLGKFLVLHRFCVHGCSVRL